MTQTLFKTLAPAFFGAVALSSTFLMPQAAQAGKVSVSGFVNFDNISLTINNNPFLTGARAVVSTSAAYSQNGLSLIDADTSGQVPIAGNLLLTETSTVIPPNSSSVEATSTINIVGGDVKAAKVEGAIALLNGITPPPLEEQGNITSNEQVFTTNFIGNAGDDILFSADLFTQLKAKIEGYQLGDEKSATAQFNATYIITQLTNLSPGQNPIVFRGPDFSNAIQFINENTDTTVDFDRVGPDPDPITGLPGRLNLPFEILTTASYRLAFNTNLTLSATNYNVSVPEPSAVLGLAGVALVGVLARKRRLG
jgi:hypothetical protein